MLGRRSAWALSIPASSCWVLCSFSRPFLRDVFLQTKNRLTSASYKSCKCAEQGVPLLQHNLPCVRVFTWAPCHPCGTRQHEEPTQTNMKFWLLDSPVSDPGISYLLQVSHDILSLTYLLGNRVKPQILQFFLWFSGKDEGLDGLG